MLSTISQVFVHLLVKDLNLLIKWEVLKLNSSWMLKLAQLNGVVGDVMVGLSVVVICRVMTLYLKFSRGWMGGWRVHSGIRSILWLICLLYLTSTCIGTDVGDAIWYYHFNITTEEEDCGRVVLWHDSWCCCCSDPLSYRPHLVSTGSIPGNTLNKTFPLPSHYISG